MRTARTATALAAMLLPFTAPAASAAELSADERAVLLEHFDRNHDGDLSDQEKARALRRTDKDGDGLVDAEVVERLQKLARKLIVHKWMTALDAVTVNRENSPQDQLSVSISKSLPMGNLHVAFVYLRWGDLSRQIGPGEGGREAYQNWDGSLVVHGAVPQKVEGIAFDEHGRLPRIGSGADRITAETRREVSWESGVVGATDGLLIRLVGPRAVMTGEITCGNFTLPLIVQPAAAGTVLPDGRTVDE